MNLGQIILILAAALGAVMVFQAFVFFLFMREMRAQNRDLLNRLMAKDFQEYIRGEAALRPEVPPPPPPPDEAIPIYS